MHPVPAVPVGAAGDGPLVVYLPLFVEHLRHRWSVPGVPQEVEDHRMSPLPQMVGAF